MIYEKAIRPLLFRFTDPEEVHHRVINTLGIASRQKVIFNTVSKMLTKNDDRLAVTLGNIKLNNPVGLGAGFDKYIEAPYAYAMLGFGFAELGSITFSEQLGNPKPRLWRLPSDKGLIVYYGLANAGSKKTSERLSKLGSHPIPYGISIAPTTGLKLEEMADDYLKTLKELHTFADYITLNVSCPNVAACDKFAQVSFIEELIEKTETVMKESGIKKDVFIKIGPHQSEADLNKIIEKCLQHSFTGIIATNLVKDRTTIKPQSKEEELSRPGGISGKLLQGQSDETIKKIYKKSGGKLKIIGVGGIFTAEDAYRKIKCGASAVQIITGFIYGGPLAIKKINQGLIELLNKDGYKNIGEAVGKDA